MSGLRRLPPSAVRKYRLFADDLPNGSYPPFCCRSRSAPVGERSATIGRSFVGPSAFPDRAKRRLAPDPDSFSDGRRSQRSAQLW
jgi:hypothetical protein